MIFSFPWDYVNLFGVSTLFGHQYINAVVEGCAHHNPDDWCCKCCRGILEKQRRWELHNDRFKMVMSQCDTPPPRVLQARSKHQLQGVPLLCTQCSCLQCRCVPRRAAAQCCRIRCVYAKWISLSSLLPTTQLVTYTSHNNNHRKTSGTSSRTPPPSQQLYNC